MGSSEGSSPRQLSTTRGAAAASWHNPCMTLPQLVRTNGSAGQGFTFTNHFPRWFSGLPRPPCGAGHYWRGSPDLSTLGNPGSEQCEDLACFHPVPHPASTQISKLPTESPLISAGTSLFPQAQSPRDAGCRAGFGGKEGGSRSLKGRKSSVQSSGRAFKAKDFLPFAFRRATELPGRGGLRPPHCRRC